MKEFTNDTLFDGRLILKQPLRGYRFSVDSILLTWFAAGGRVSRDTVDLGAGCGVIGLGLILAGQSKRVTAVEVQSRLAALATENAALNKVKSSFEQLSCDVRDVGDFLTKESYDLVVANPPFWSADTGRLPQNEERRIACHAVLASLEQWVAATHYLLRPKSGRLCMVFPARRLDELLIALSKVHFSCSRLCFVHPFADKTAELVLIEALRGAKGRIQVEPPLFLKQKDGCDTIAAANIYQGEFSEMLEALPDRRASLPSLSD